MTKAEMTPHNTAMLRIYLQGVTMGHVEDPHVLYRTLAPNAVRREWVPQTMGDQIWLFFAFDGEEEKISFVRSLPANLGRCVEQRLDESYFVYI